LPAAAIGRMPLVYRVLKARLSVVDLVGPPRLMLMMLAPAAAQRLAASTSVELYVQAQLSPKTLTM